MNRRYRLTSAADFQRVWRTGKTYAHPLVICAVLENARPHSRFGVTTKRGLGNAVLRNRTRRRLREALRMLQPDIVAGWDIIVMARPVLIRAEWSEVLTAISSVLHRAGLLERNDERANHPAEQQ